MQAKSFKTISAHDYLEGVDLSESRKNSSSDQSENPQGQ
jgi:hypothetical protein